ncbi:hypothetical protein F2S72_01290 [Pseudomonas syringae pv. actinidiae]|nr:hypothetical protein [Pseudomonas syringae pv. actinidiae]
MPDNLQKKDMLFMTEPSTQEQPKHIFQIKLQEKERLERWLKRCPDVTFIDDVSATARSLPNHPCARYAILPGEIPATAGSFLLEIYTDLPSLDASLLGALRDRFAPVWSSEK